MFKTWFVGRLFVLTSILLAIGSVVSGQVIQGQIAGTITDESGVAARR